jgi:hypothetical protein
VITSAGNRNPANADRWTRGPVTRGRRTPTACLSRRSAKTRAWPVQQTRRGAVGMSSLSPEFRMQARIGNTAPQHHPAKERRGQPGEDLG